MTTLTEQRSTTAALLQSAMSARPALTPFRAAMMADARALIDELDHANFEGCVVREIVARMMARLDSGDGSQTKEGAEQVIVAALGADRVRTTINRVETRMSAGSCGGAEPIENVAFIITIHSAAGEHVTKSGPMATLALAMDGLIEKAREWFERRGREQEQERFDSESEADRFDMLD